jgi:hypothetical protein
MKLIYHIALVVLLVGTVEECREPYLPPEIQNVKNYLVVDGTLHIGSDSTYITLSRTRSLQDSVPNIPELNAQVTVVSQNGLRFDLKSVGNGVYATDYLGLSPNERCQLWISTADGKQYLADSILVLNSPPIDSVSWKQDTFSVDNKKGVYIYVTTHDPNNSTWYYRWEYQETYEYHAKYDSYLFWKNNTYVPRLPSEHTYACWKDHVSTELMLATSVGLQQDIIFENPLVFIPQGSQELSVLYSILVKQTALTREAYDYLQSLRKNTELTGSIFDPQPSQNTGNIRCLEDANEPVLGYVYASTVQKERLYISYRVIQHWGYFIMGCELLTGDSTLAGRGLFPIEQVQRTIYHWAEQSCVDCTLDGGRTIKPGYWP